ncbi:MAG: sugar phosphate nucleotidyltransferase [Acidobacteriota bacterium]
MNAAPPHLFALVLAGGSGTRFWPLSRRARPKQLLPLLPSAPGKSLLAVALERIEALIPEERRLVVAPESMKDAILASTGIAPDRLIVEPAPRNTSPAMFLGVSAILERDQEACVAVLTADHEIAPASALCEAIAHAAEVAIARDAIVTFGIRPDAPNTGYGYIEAGEPLPGDPLVRGVAAFREKPDAATAAAYVASGRHFWNSGMFVFPAAHLLRSYLGAYPELDGFLSFDRLPATSIDYAVMERERGLLVMEARFSWTDVGAPSALEALWPDGGRDDASNCSQARLLAVDAARNLVITERREKTVALLGVNDLVIIETDDVLLVVPKHRDQEIKKLVELAGKKGMERAL